MQNEEQTTPPEQAPQEPPPPPKAGPPALLLDDQGLVKVETLADEMRVCASLVAAGMVPESLNTAAKLFGARQLCRELGLPVMSAIRQVYVVNGSPSLWGDTPLALVRRSGMLEAIDEYLVDADYNRICLANKNLAAEPFASVCEVKRTGQPGKQFFFTMAMAEKAGLLAKNRSLWKVYPLRMLQMKARGLALKNEFSDVLMGVAMAEYDYDQVPGVVAREVGETTADKANAAFGVDLPPDIAKD